MISKQAKIFVESYIGDEVEAARMAGYSNPSESGKRLMQDPRIQEAIIQRSKYEAAVKNAVATREDRQALWSQIMRNEDPYRKPEYDNSGVPIPESNIPLASRLRASELLAKSEGDFIDRVHIDGNVTVTDIIKQSYTIEAGEDDLDAIEAEYEQLREKKTEQIENFIANDTKVEEESPQQTDVSVFI